MKWDVLDVLKLNIFSSVRPWRLPCAVPLGLCSRCYGPSGTWTSSERASGLQSLEMIGDWFLLHAGHPSHEFGQEQEMHQRSPKYFCIFLRCSGQVRIVSNLFGLPLDPAESAGSTRQRPATQCQWSTSSRPGTARFDAFFDMPRCLDSPVVTYLVWQMNVKVDDNMMIITWWSIDSLHNKINKAEQVDASWRFTGHRSLGFPGAEDEHIWSAGPDRWGKGVTFVKTKSFDARTVGC